MNFLFVTYGLPVPPDSGARLRDFNLIKRVAQHHRVSVLSLLEFEDEMHQAEDSGLFVIMSMVLLQNADSWPMS